jgi:hypothetical protein
MLKWRAMEVGGNKDIRELQEGCNWRRLESDGRVDVVLQGDPSIVAYGSYGAGAAESSLQNRTEQSSARARARVDGRPGTGDAT